MPRAFPLQTLLELAQRKTDAAAKTLQALQARRREAEEKLQQLLEYREAYRARMLASAGGGMSGMVLRDFQLFLGKLDLAIKLQREEVERCGLRCETARQEWLAQRRKRKAFDALSVRHRRAEEQRDGRIEQKEQDEFAGKAAQKRSQDEE